MTPPPPEPAHQYPDGEDAPGYRLAFTAWIVLFLLVLCIGLLNYLGMFLKTRWPGM